MKIKFPSKKNAKIFNTGTIGCVEFTKCVMLNQNASSLEKSAFSLMLSFMKLAVQQICALLENYAALNGSCVPTFRYNISVPSPTGNKFFFFLLGLLDPCRWDL
jgi:hypothetical protein